MAWWHCSSNIAVAFCMVTPRAFYYTDSMMKLFLDEPFPDTHNTFRGMTTTEDFWRVRHCTSLVQLSPCTYCLLTSVVPHRPWSFPGNKRITPEAEKLSTWFWLWLNKLQNNNASTVVLPITVPMYNIGDWQTASNPVIVLIYVYPSQ